MVPIRRQSNVPASRLLAWLGIVSFIFVVASACSRVEEGVNE